MFVIRSGLIIVFSFIGFFLSGWILLGYSDYGRNIAAVFVLPILSVALLIGLFRFNKEVNRTVLSDRQQKLLVIISVAIQFLLLLILLYLSRTASDGLYHWEEAGSFFSEDYLHVDRSVALISIVSLITSNFTTTIISREPSQLILITALPGILIILFQLSLMIQCPNHPYPQIGG